MKLNSNPTSTKSGTYWLEIVSNTNASDAEFEIKSMGDITYEFDLTPKDTKAPYIGGIPGSMTVVAWDKMSNTGSLYDTLQTSIGTYSLVDYSTMPVADATLYLLPPSETNGSNAYTFPFSLRFSDIGLDEIAHDTTMKLSPRRLTQTVGEWELQYGSAGFPEQIPILYNDGAFNVVEYNCYAVGDVIKNVVGGLEQNGSLIFETALLMEMNTGGQIYAFPTKEMISDSSNLVNNAFPEAGFWTPAFFVGQGPPVNSEVWVVGQENIVYNKVAAFAGMEGAIFGSAFGVNFYMKRTTNTYNVELSEPELAELKFVTTPRDLATIQLSYSNTNLLVQEAEISNFNAANVGVYPSLPTVLNYSIIYDAWKGQSDDLQLDYVGFQPQMQIGVVRPAYDPMTINTISEPNERQAQFYLRPLADEALRQYAPALGLSLANTASFRIEADILGVDKIRPYEVIKFDNTVPLRYQGKHFRPTSLSYDLKADKVRVTAYQIDTFPFDDGGNVEVTFCEPDQHNVTAYAWNTQEFTNFDTNGVNVAQTYTWNTNETTEICNDGENVAIGGAGATAQTFFTDTAISNV